MTDLQTKQLAVLDATCAEYNSTNRAASETKCFYWDPVTHRRCAIGRLLTEQQAMHLQSNFEFIGSILHGFSESTDELDKSIYDDLSKYGVKFLNELQFLHDCARNWDDEGLTTKGIEFAEYVKTRVLANEYA